jgi:predicted phosphodiesterase
MQEDAIDFLRDIRRAWRCDKVVHIGDVVDWHCISYHEKDLNDLNYNEEFNTALRQVQKLKRAFPKLTVMTGNHDSLPHRRACTAGLPGSVIKGNYQIWETPQWEWMPRYAKLEVDNCIYMHGDNGKGGITPALANAKDLFQSVVAGHHHSSAGVYYHANPNSLVFGMNVGCLVDWHHASMSYGVKFNKKPILGCGVVIDGKHAVFEPMIR